MRYKNVPTYEAIKNLSAKNFLSEEDTIAHLLEHAGMAESLSAQIEQQAAQHVETIRTSGRTNGVEAFLAEYGLNTAEGVAVMCLAEALLRIPDAPTADDLIHDKFSVSEWESKIGESDNLLVSASSVGLMVSSRIIRLGDNPQDTVWDTLKRLTHRTGEPVIRHSLKRAMKLVGGQFVLGQTIKNAFKNAKTYTKKGYRFSYDMLGEGARTHAQAEGYFASYQEAIAALGTQVQPNAPLWEQQGISIKLSALHPQYHLTHYAQLEEELYPKMLALCEQAKDLGIAVAIDAEEAARLDVSLLLFSKLAHEPSLALWEGLGMVVQAYQKRALYVIEFLRDLAAKRKCRMPVRLVKGAYWDTEIKHAQSAGLSTFPVFSNKSYTDVSYLACAEALLCDAQYFFPQFASHNAHTITAVCAMADKYRLSPDAFELQRLYGMGEVLHDVMLKEGYASRVYAPVGQHQDLLAYLIRRLLENGANSSFVYQIYDKAVPAEAIVTDPIRHARQLSGMSHSQIPLPEALYSDRKNSAGFELGYLCSLEQLMADITPYQAQQWQAEALLATDARNETAQDVLSPVQGRKVGTVAHCSAASVDAAVNAAWDGFEAWQNMSVDARAVMLETAADLLEARMDEWLALCAREAGKTLDDGIAEVREAADFCRYYAMQARQMMSAENVFEGPTGEHNSLSLHPRGVFICISPWNFPLAIFIGQITAALATGNAVIAKPAEQTPLIAYEAVKLLHEAGIPKAVLQLALGDGALGAALVAHPDISGVVFTGSTNTARHINRALAAKDTAIVPLIAETGGQNGMIVDSSALLEQAVDDIVLSAFGSAGQRCSALRVLCVQEEIADKLIAMVSGAMDTLHIGDPIHPMTNIGPVIDTTARTGLMKHITRMEKEATIHKIAEIPESYRDKGSFIAPHFIEITSLDQLTEEQFGPILHVLRYKSSELEAMCKALNNTGYGLTFGMHSRIEEHVQLALRNIRAGNRYINRNTTGAVVGVQPFGGEGLSGTGPKAGGPHYLQRFVNERTTTINTAAIGGDVSLLAGNRV